MRNKYFLGAGLSAASVLLAASVVSAHVIVTPKSAGVGSFQVFSMAVPSEKDIPTTAIKLIIPDGVKFVTPNVKPGWRVEVKTQGTGKKITDDDGMQMDEMKPIEIDWTGGNIPAGQRDEFEFQAQVPAAAATLAWKAYQTYSDGSVVAWDQTPGDDVDNPYSITSVVNDLSTPPTNPQSNNLPEIALLLGIVSIVVSIYALTKKPKS